MCDAILLVNTSSKVALVQEKKMVLENKKDCKAIHVTCTADRLIHKKKWKLLFSFSLFQKMFCIAAIVAYFDQLLGTAHTPKLVKKNQYVCVYVFIKNS